MLTRSGWLLLIVAIVALVVGRALVLDEVVILGVIGALLAAVSFLAVWAFCPKTRVQRHHPSSVVSVDEEAEVGIQFETRLWPPVKLPIQVRDSFKHYRPGAEAGLSDKTQSSAKKQGKDYESFTVSFNLSGGSTSVAYSFVPSRRGIVRFGPLQVRASDPFGIARRKWQDASATEILALPPIEDVIPPQLSLIAESQQEEACSIWQGSPSGDFLTLREYAHGDDLRQVHWKSSARTGNLMIRQSEHRRETGAALVLDTRSSAASRQDFEKMVGAAASLCVACRNHRIPLQLATFLPRQEILRLNDDDSLEEALRMLALVPQSAEARPLQDFETHGALVVLTGDRLESDIDGGSGTLEGLNVCFGEQHPHVSGMWVPPAAKFSDVWNGYFWETGRKAATDGYSGMPAEVLGR